MRPDTTLARGRTIRNLSVFTVIVLSIGWTGRWLDGWTGDSASEGPGILLWLVAPTVTALGLRTGMALQFVKNILRKPHGAASIVVMMAWAVVYGELLLLTRSIWPAVLMHAVEDALLNQLFIDGHIALTPGSDWLVSPVHGLISILLFVALGVALRRYRLASGAGHVRHPGGRAVS